MQPKDTPKPILFFIKTNKALPRTQKKAVRDIRHYTLGVKTFGCKHLYQHISNEYFIV